MKQILMKHILIITELGLSIAKLLTERMNGTISASYSDNRLHIAVTFLS